MDTAGYILLSRLTVQQRATDVIAHNIANADTPGFRGSQSLFSSFLSRAGGSATAGPAHFVDNSATWRNMSAAPLRATGNPLDLALPGDGFFVVQTGRGDRYTRAGHFALSPDGTVVDTDGNALLGEDGPIQLPPDSREIMVAGDGTMTLRSASGQEIEARLLSANGESVRIERVGDGREFVVPLSSFDEYTGERVRQWMERAPGVVEYSFAVEANRFLVDSSTFMSAGRDLKTAEWSYRVKFTNLTRNELRGAQLEYRVVYDDEVIIDRAVVAPGKGANQQDGQLLDLPDMSFNDEVEFETPPIALHTYEFVPQRGEREYSRDSVKGLWLRVMKN
jgi:flagellar basal-body rod protein FlgF